MKIKEVTNYLEEIAPLQFQESYDNSGLILGDRENEITSVLVCIDSTEEVIDEAIRKRCNLIIAHHPIIFSGIKRLTGENHIERVLIKAIQNNIAIYVIHTNLDNVLGGVNTKIADLIGLKNPQILCPMKELLRKLVVYVPKDNVDELEQTLFNAGAGKIGNYQNCSFKSLGTGTFLANKNANPRIGSIGSQEIVDEVKLEVVFTKNIENTLIEKMKKTHPYEEISYQIYVLENTFNHVGSGVFGDLDTEISSIEFLKNLKSKMKTDCVRHTKLVKKSIKRVAICGGSGAFLLNKAKMVKSDIFISSDFKYHDFFNSENEIIIADIGHYESEQFTKELIYDMLINNFSKFAVLLSKVNTNPINYL